MKKAIWIFLVVVLLVVGGTFSFLYWGTYSEGIRAGVVIKLTKKGFIFKTYEGQLNLETFGAIKGATAMRETFDFSVDPSQKEITSQLEAVALSGERVSLHYKERFVTWPWLGDTKYFVSRVERIKP